MSQRFIEELRNENLSNHLILPLLKLNKFSFLSSNLINTYLEPNGKYIFVVVVDLTLLSRRVLNLHPNWSFIYKGKDHYKISYSLIKWQKDVEYFMSGNFSRMSGLAKEYISRYRTPNADFHYFQGLNKDRELKEMWEREIGDIRLDASDELLSKPDKRAFMTLDEFYEKSDSLMKKG